MDLDELRKKVDEADAQIIELLVQRYAAVTEIGKIKRSAGRPVYVPEREKFIYEKLSALNHGRMNEVTLHAVYREIMSGALLLEQPLRIVYPGSAFSCAYHAAVSKFGQSIRYLPVNNMDEVISCLTDGRADYGCVPLEDLLHQTFIQSDIRICAGINPENEGRYFVIGRQSSQPTGNDRTMVCFELKNKAGLPAVLSLFKNEETPFLQERNGMVFMELHGHQNDSSVSQVMEQLSSMTSAFHILGSYPD